MEERDWQIIKTLYEQKNITKTARVLYMSQPTLTARKKATARTCYTKKEGLFLPQFGPFKEPSFREDYKSPLTYVLYDDSLFSQPQAADTYFSQLFCWLLEQ